MMNVIDPAFIRMKTEKDELAHKVKKLEEFTRSARLGELPENLINHSELQLLEEQLHYMRGYLRVLNARIQRVEDQNSV